MKSGVDNSNGTVTVAIGVGADNAPLAAPGISPIQADFFRSELYRLQQKDSQISANSGPQRLSPELLAQVTDLPKPS